MDDRTIDLARRVRAATAPSSELGQLARQILLEDHDARMDGRQAGTGPGPLACYFCDRLATTIEAGYATCEPMFHDSQRRRLEDVPSPEDWRDGAVTRGDLSDALAGAVDAIRQAIRPAPEHDGYEATHWTADELHRHTIGAQTWEHAHEGGHEPHSAVSHDLSDAEIINAAPLPAYIWSSPNGKGWVDAWNGWYATEAEAREGGAGGDGRLWVLKLGEGIISEDEADERRAAMVAGGEEYSHLGGRA